MIKGTERTRLSPALLIGPSRHSLGCDGLSRRRTERRRGPQLSTGVAMATGRTLIQSWSLNLHLDNDM